MRRGYGGLDMRRFMMLFFVLASVPVFAGCETIKGAGRDITKAGEAIEEAVR